MNKEIGRYKRVQVRLWRHPGFRALTETGQRVTFYLLTGPQTNRIGLFNFSVSTASEDICVGVDTLRKRLSDVCQTFGWLHDADARAFFIRSWWKWNPPENANVLTGNLKDLMEIPPCALVDAFAENIGTLHQTLHQTFVECCHKHLGERSPIQDSGSVIRNRNRNRTQQKQAHEKSASEPECEVDERLVHLAHEVISSASQAFDERVDALQYLARDRHRGVNVTRSVATIAINKALSEAQRTA